VIQSCASSGCITLQDGKARGMMAPRRREYRYSQRPRASGNALTCLAGVSPIYGAAWNGRMKCTTGTGDQADQEHEAMAETAHRLYETSSQSGAPALAMMQSPVSFLSL
jgi:hypothetical protein